MQMNTLSNAFRFLTFSHHPLDALKLVSPRDLAISSALAFIMLNETGSGFGILRGRVTKATTLSSIAPFCVGDCV